MDCLKATAWLVAVLGVFSPCPTFADLPIHCMHSEVLGTWDIHLGQSTTEKDPSCGHAQPDSIMTMPERGIDFAHPHFSVKKKTTITLSNPDQAVDGNGNKGTWTMVYDEGFEVCIGDETYFTFFKYTPIVDQPDKSKVADFHSYCDVTVSGWHTNGKARSCFVASKQKARSISFGHEETPESSKPCHDHSRGGDQQVLIAVEGCGGSGDTAVVASTPPRFRAVHAAVQAARAKSAAVAAAAASQGTFMRRTRSFDTAGDATFHSDTAFIDHINSDKTATWTAKAHEHLEGKSVTDILHMLGHRHFEQAGSGAEAAAIPSHLHLVPHVNILAPSATVLVVGGHHGHDDNHGFPAVYDWRKIDGGVYMTPVIEQGGCGSCYSVASTDVATMRYRIKHGKDNPKALKTIFSPQSVLGCSRTNQGCDGGYPYLVGKHGVEMGFVPDSCQPYEGDDSCKRECFDGEHVVHAKSYEYIGGYYGAGNELAMLKALKRGPIVVAVNAPPDLLYFHEGVYSHPLSHMHDEYDVNGISRWEKTNHAIAAVGWGEEMLHGERVKYWICKNSWGERWGDEGYFYVRRGSDAMAIESMAVEILF